MGNHKFRFSNMIPNAWFHKLSPRPDRHETLNRTTKHSSDLSEQRKSYYFTRDLLTLKPDNNNNSPAKTTEIPVHERRRRSTNKNHRQRLGSIDDHGSLPPIVTKKNEGEDLLRRFSGVKLRTNSPRIVNWRRRRSASISECSFAVVKASQDPRRDFRESMVEMIVENNIRSSKDLEQLLACYLSLNSEEYHRLIINVFKQIWFEFRPLIN